MRRFLNMFFRDADDGAGSGSAGGTQPKLTEQEIQSIVSAIEARQQRAGNSAAKAIAEQYGMSAEEMSALLKAEQDKKAAQIPADAQKQIDAANAKLQEFQLSADVQRLGTAMGMVDADVVMKLMDRSTLTYKDGKYGGIQEALDALKESKPYLFQQEKGGAWGQQRKGGAPGTETNARDELRKAMFGH